MVAQTRAEARPAPRAWVDRRFLVGAVVIAVLSRLEGLLWPLKPDEAGIVIVGRNWHPAAENMYGYYWVDRPPILVGLVRLADHVGGPYAPRFVIAALAVVMVVSAYRIGQLLGGVRCARWTAAVAVALGAHPDLELWAAKSESLGVPLVVASCWLSLEALHARGTRRLWLAAAAGLTGALAVGMKQNLVAGAVFGVVLLVAAVRTHRLSWAEVRPALAAAAAGFVVPVLVVVGWALARGVELHTLWYMLFGFRSDAFQVIFSGHMTAPLTRARALVELFFSSGLALVAAALILALRDSLRSHFEVTVAAVAVSVLDVVGLVLSGSYWSTYLGALIPSAVLATAVLTSTRRRRWRLAGRIAVAVIAASSAISATIWTIGHLNGHTTPMAQYVGAAVGAASSPDDTIVVLYGRADVVLASGLRPAYEHLWSLPARTLDPQLDELRGLLSGPNAPTWVVEYNPIDSWHIDRDGKLRALLDSQYDVAGTVCDRPVYVHRGVTRPPLPAVDCAAAWRS